MRVRYTPRARADLISILTFIERQSPQGAQNVARALRKTIELIGQFPQVRSGRERNWHSRIAGRPLSVLGLLERRSKRRVDCSYSTYGPPTVESRRIVVSRHTRSPARLRRCGSGPRGAGSPGNSPLSAVAVPWGALRRARPCTGGSLLWTFQRASAFWPGRSSS